MGLGLSTTSNGTSPLASLNGTLFFTTSATWNATTGTTISGWWPLSNATWGSTATTSTIVFSNATETNLTVGRYAYTGAGWQWAAAPRYSSVAPEILRRREQERQREQARAKKRAERLLLRYLDRSQRRDFLEQRRFEMVAPSGNRYRIAEGRQHNVYLLDGAGQPAQELCVVPWDRQLPVGDILLAQKFFLEHHEEEALRAANIWALRPGRPMLHRGQGEQVAA
jgi:hypothetical protein